MYIEKIISEHLCIIIYLTKQKWKKMGSWNEQVLTYKWNMFSVFISNNNNFIYIIKSI